jgi:uncharacterized delta-60 repeat protein
MRALAGSFSTLMLGSLGCSGSPGTEENLGTENAALKSGSLAWTLATTSQGGEEYYDVKVQPNGSLIAAGYILEGNPPTGMNLKVARVTSAGHLDTTFAKGGVFSYALNNESEAFSTATLSNGNILVVGQTITYAANTSNSRTKAYILQLNSAGQLVTSFGTRGVIQLNIGCCDDSANDIVVQPDGKFLIAGYTSVYGSPPGPSQYSATKYPMVARLLSTGAFDTSFGTKGVAKGTGLIYDIDANSDNTFHRVILQPNGRIIGIGHGQNPNTYYSALLERFTSAGVVDTTFGTGGSINDTSISEYNRAQLLSNGNIVAAGNAGQTVVAQYSSAGKLVTTFGKGGKATLSTPIDGRSVAIQADGKIVVSGESTATGAVTGAIARLLSAGSPDTSFGASGIAALSGPVNSLALQSNGQIVGAGHIPNASPPPYGDSVLYSLNP